MSGSRESAGDSADVARRLYPRLQALAIALTGDPGAGATLARATLARLEATGFAGRGQTSLLLWAYRETHTHWLHETSKSGAGKSRPDPRCFAVSAGSAEDAARQKGLAQAIATLPAQQRATLLLVYGEGLSYDEVAEVFDVSLKDVMTRVVRGHVAIGHWFDRCDGDPQQAMGETYPDTAGQVA